MKQPEVRLRLLLEQYLSGELSEEDTFEFLGYVQDPVFENKLKQLLGESFTVESEPVQLADIQQQLILGSIFKDTKTRRISLVKMAVAACFLAMLSFGLYIYIQQTKNSPEPFINIGQDITPGRLAATLTLSDGAEIQLSDQQTGDITQESGIRISRTAEGQLIYTIEDSKSLQQNGWNTLTTKNGESYQVQLPDGTTVWLNSGTSLSYPTSFTAAKTRNIRLDGEAYFEVARDIHKPFLVSTVNQLIEVLGTQFNVNSYASAVGGRQKKSAITTLVEGSVKVQKTFNGRIEPLDPGLVLKPGEQSIELDGELQLRKVADLEEITSWKEGYFKFNENLHDILAKVARWYDIEVEYQYQPPSTLTFSGKISREKPLSDLLKIISYNDEVHFKIEGRRVVVMK